MNQEKIGKFLLLLRRERKMTQAQLSEILNVSDKTISKWERGICLPKMSTIETIIVFYNISLEEFYVGERKKDSDEEKLKKIIEDNIKQSNSKKHKILITIGIGVNIFLIFILISIVICLLFKVVF